MLDPFAGSGTTCQVAQKLLRNSAGIEILPQYYQLAKENLNSIQGLLFEETQYETHYTTERSLIMLQRTFKSFIKKG